jgi:tetratricopeptide (TPR) repeat protein
MKLLLQSVLWGCLGVSVLTAYAQTPAERHIQRAEKLIEANSGDWGGYRALAMAYAQRGRETSDHDWYDKAQSALDRAPAKYRETFELQKTQVWIDLGQHRFQKAYASAKALSEKTPDDVAMYGMLADAAIETGRYAEAELAIQWMLDMRPGDVGALARGGHMRELYGDREGAIELLEKAYQRIAATEVEHRAWVLTHLAHLHRTVGRHANAEALLDQAFKLFPGYHYALLGLARVRSDQGRFSEASALLEKRYTNAPHPENLYDLAVAQQAAGEHAKAKKSFRAFEKEALAESQGDDNANHELIDFYLQQRRTFARALALAEQESARRQDWRTRLRYADAFARLRKPAQAEEQLEPVLKLGLRDGRVWLLGTELALARKQHDVARERLRVAKETRLSTGQQAQLARLERQLAVGRKGS